jgi:hypothetical protein
MTDTEFFKQLIKKTEEAFKRSPINNKNNLAYSISATPLRVGKPLILGINWGGYGHGFESQERMPKPEELTADIIKSDYKFLERSKAYLEEYLNLDLDRVDFNYSNLCFFRSRAEKDLTFADYQNSYPLVKELIQYLKPEYILVFGVTA